MAVAELLLRLGCTLTGWMVLLTHGLWLASLGATGCTSEGSQPWLALLWLTPLTLLFAALLPVGLAVPGVARILRLPTLAMVPLLVFAVRTAWTTWLDVNVAGNPLCDSSAAWTLAWSPSQLFAAVWIGVAVGILWVRAGRTALARSGPGDTQRNR